MTTGYFSDAEALKGSGVGTSKYGSGTDVCGLQLCSEIPGGKSAWMEEKGKAIPVAPVEEKEMKETMMEKDDSMMEETMMEKDDSMIEEISEKEITEADLGSVLRLSRANVPTIIHMHHGYYDGEDVFYIITDSSDPKHAEIITEKQG